MRPPLMLVVAACLGVPVLAEAQQQSGAPVRVEGPAPAPQPITEPRLPANPQSPTDFQSTVNAPGMPQPGKAPPAAGPAGTEAASPAGYTGGDMIIDDTGPRYGGRVTAPRRQIPAEHEVRKGDTLWDICDYYYADPWAWPQVWAYNKQITNPHWIYPGDRVRLLRAPTLSARTGERPEPIRVAGSGGGLGAAAGGGPSGMQQPVVQLRQNGFVDPSELSQAGRVVGSPVERLMLSAFDNIYIEGDEKWRPQRGQYYTIYKVRQELKSEGKKIGYVVEILGTAQVRSVNDKNVATATITESLAPIERGHLVGPARRRLARVAPQPASQNVEGEVIATMRPGKYVSSDELVFVSRGRNQGVREGNRFLVVRRGDAYKRLVQESDDPDPKFPQETVAEVTILDARDDSSVGLVTRAVKEVKIGDKVRMRRGY